jgi:NAD-dependent histone deacetylase SIR2
LQDPQEVFSLNLFHEDPSIFFSVAKDILPGEKVFTPTHAFIRLLEDQGKLLTNYTQNIDNIEDHAGISREKIVQCHGSFATATCVKCKHQVPGQDIFPDIRAGLIPKCLKCIESLKSLSVPGGMKRKRSKNGSSKKRTHSKNRNEFSDSSDEQDYEIPQPGIMKPDITFFGEDLPDEFQTRLGVHDKNKVDLVIVIGTSLKVAPVADVIPYLPAHVPQMYISRDPISHFEFDIDMLGECDVIVSELCKRIGWELKHEMIPKERKVDVKLTDGFKSRHTFKEQKAPSST